MRWLLLKDLQLLRRSPLQAALLVIYPVLIALLVGFAISRNPGKPRVAFLNQVPQNSQADILTDLHLYIGILNRKQRKRFGKLVARDGGQRHVETDAADPPCPESVEIIS